MFQRVADALTFGGSAWYETVPWIVAGVFFVIEVVVRIWRKRRPVLDAMALTYAFGEDMSLATIGTCVPAFAF